MISLFDYNISLISDRGNKTSLPFSVFGMTQEGLSHRNLSLGNQDSGCIYVGRRIIAGAVTDGCSSGNNVNGMSSNHVGANILAYLSVMLIRRLALKEDIDGEKLRISFQRQLFSHLKNVLYSIAPRKEDRSAVLFNFLTSTLVFFVLTKQQYFVFSCGDGDAYLNGVRKGPNGASGIYFSNSLARIEYSGKIDDVIDSDFHIQSIANGDSTELNNLLISTDGFIDTDIEEDYGLKDFFFNNKEDHSKRGFINRRAEFNTSFLERTIKLKNGRLWPIDDATFISLKRAVN